ncbi:hypothetical protein C5167_022067 [Papaver somniferum]|uniref:protein-serine/threonine phosphatase n=1 Tax=Papaver somniferum TaxID=3469 RepID=A0A4Y7JHS3_PAPSO|nr:RNA polymerase II C-terminal domain phosphatase-like 3 [Papaver somniferum]RZC60307.1 hypothetical protein C5167_022067 [Papaver somniferum]
MITVDNQETLISMENKESMIDDDLEEGEISDDMSVEEITEEDFGSVSSKLNSRVHMEDLLDYSVSRNKNDFVYHDFLVQSKMEGMDFVNAVVIDDSSDESESECKIEVDYDELEEGEIDELDVVDVDDDDDEEKDESNGDNFDTKNMELGDDNQIHSTPKELTNVTVNEDEKSFAGICVRYLESLQLIVRCADGEVLFQKSFTGIQALNAVFSTMTPSEKQDNIFVLKRLLTYVKTQGSRLLPAECMKEIDVMLHSLDSPSDVSSVKAYAIEREVFMNNEEKELVSSVENPPLQDLSSLKKLDLQAISVKPRVHIERNMGPEALRTGLTSCKVGTGGFGPLVDLHRHHDMDSLPSPTREILKPLSITKNQAQPNLPAISLADKSEDAIAQLCKSDALEVVSVYQPKFGSNLLTDRLPNPIPSGELHDGNGDEEAQDLSDRVSSVPYMVSSTKETLVVGITGEMASDCPVLSCPARSSSLGPAHLEVVTPAVNSSSQSAYLSQPIGGMMNSKNCNIGEQSVLEGRSLKRQRNGFTPSDITEKTQPNEPSNNNLSGNMKSDLRKAEHGEKQLAISAIHNVQSSEREQFASLGTSNAVSLPDLIKDVGVNSTTLVHLVKKYHRLGTNSQQKSGDSAKKATSLFSSTAIPLFKKYFNPREKPIVKPQITDETPTNPQGELSKIRLKDRDPRKNLHYGTFQQNKRSRFEQFEANGADPSVSQSGKDSFSLQHQGHQETQTTTSSFQSAQLPDIASEFTKNLKNVADILSIDNTSVTVAEPVLSQQIPENMDRVEMGIIATDCDNRQNKNCLPPEEHTKEPSQSPNPWGEMEHIFEGYDELQKATILRERERRIEEQNKMFAAKKLCLVLDLDHTLLNSAKFIEIDPVHQELLRMKEEKERGKSQRHLFRFPHMGMWTKLRPGVWNFLEKASKLYELHLYTMGNKRYATEMAKLLDPSGALFSGRVISRGDDGESLDGDERPKIKDLDGVLGMESAVVIIDDSVRVWPHYKLNMIAVERYIYFPCSRRQFGLLGPSLLEVGHDERSENGTLASSLAVIERIHRTFFSHQCLKNLDVRNILASEQKKILAGCRIVFSRVFPVGLANPKLHPLWQTAEQFGAVCTNQIDERVTHIVATSLGTDKVNWALSSRRFVVQPGWVEASAFLYRRADERAFAV